MTVDLGAVPKKREQRYSYGLSLLRDSIEKKERFLAGDEDIGKKIILSAKDITLTFGGLSALSSVDLDLREGELLAIIGPNGAGKTSLLNVISGFYRAQKGDVSFQGRKITKLGRGLPVGSELEYADEETLSSALESRR